MKKIKFITIFWPLFYLLLFIILLKGGFSYLDPDFGWHLQSGEEISQSGQVPRVNHYNYTYTGNWVNHEWLSDWAAFKIYNAFGYEVLVSLFAALIVFVMILLNIFWYQKLKTQYLFWLTAALQLLGVQAALPHFGVRMQELALLFVLLVLIIIFIYQKKRNWRWLFLFPPMLFIWSCLHASFLLGFFLLFAWLGIKIGERLVYDTRLAWRPAAWFYQYIESEKILTWQQIVLFFLFSALSLAATFFTPYQFELYSFLSGYQNTAYLSLIQEWLPQHSFPLHYNQLVYLALGATALIFYFYERLRKKMALDWWQVFLVVLFLFLSWQSRRHFPLFLIVSFGLLLEVYSDFFKDIKLAYRNWLKGLVITCLILLIVAKTLTITPASNPFHYFCQEYPCQAVDFLKNNPFYHEYNIFNKYSWGGFLIRVWPEKKIFIDGRLPQVKFAGQTFVEEYFDFFQEDTDVAAKLKSYDIRLVLITATDKPLELKRWEKIFFNIKNEDLLTKNFLRDYLDSNQAWELIYSDNVANIYFLAN